MNLRRIGILLFTAVSLSLIWIRTSLVVQKAHAQTGCDYTIGAGEQYTTFEALNLNTPGTDLAGKTVCVRSNKTYGNVEIHKSGTGENQWLIIKSHPANGSVKPKFSAANDNAIQINGRYVVVDGLEVTSAGNKQGIVIVDTDHVKLLNASVSNTWSNGIHVDSSSYVWVDGCVVHKAVMSTGNPVGENVRANDSDHVWISNCLIKEDGSGRGGVLNSGQSDYITLRNNELYMNDSNNLHLGNGDNIVFENNLVSATCGNDGTGFYRMAEGYSWYQNPPYKNTNITIHNNLIVNMGMGMSFQVCQDIEGSERCPFKNVTVSNNTVVGIGMTNSGEKEDKEYAFFASNNSDTPVENVVIRDNIFHTNNGSENDYKSSWTGTVSFAGNLWSDMTGVPTQGNQLVNNWGSVFVSQPNLTTCVNSRINPDSYRVATSQGGKGADVSKVGIGRGDGSGGTGSPPPPPPSPLPTTSPSSVPFDYDVNNDQQLTFDDVRLLIVNLVKQFNSDFNPDTNQKLNVLDFGYFAKQQWGSGSSPAPSSSPSSRPSPGASPSTSPDGQSLLVFSSATNVNDPNTKEIYTIRPNGTQLTRITNNNFDDEGAMLSPDRSKIAFKSNRDGNFEIYVMNTNGTNLRRLTNNAAHDQGLSWSPNGMKIAFGSDRDGDFEIYTMNSTDGGNLAKLTNNNLRDRTASWSPGGVTIAFTCTRGDDLDICTILSDGTNETNITASSTTDDAIASWHPGGAQIAYRRGLAGNYEIWKMNSDGSLPVNLTNRAGDDMGPTWSPDGNKIAFSSMRDGNSEIYVMNADGSNQNKVINLPTSSEDDIDWR